VNLYRVDANRGTAVLYLADLPGYGHAGGGERTAREFDRLTAEYFRDQGPGPGGQRPGARARGKARWIAGVILAIDARHPGLERDVAALRWLQAQSAPVAVVATKFDKLTQAERMRTRRQMETSFGVAALPVSAATGEGLDQLWKTLLKWIRHN
jgi:GTP-binding protein